MRVVQPFTSDKTVLNAALSGITANAQNTLLYESVQKALGINRQKGMTIPAEPSSSFPTARMRGADSLLMMSSSRTSKPRSRFHRGLHAGRTGISDHHATLVRDDRRPFLLLKAPGNRPDAPEDQTIFQPVLRNQLSAAATRCCQDP